MSDSTPTCTAATADGTPCKLPASRGDGRCHIHTDEDDASADVGRPSLLTEYREEMLDAARLGMSKKGIANTAGVAESTLYRWLNEYPEFQREFWIARGEGELRLIHEALDPDGDVPTSVATFLLERSYGYTKTTSVEHRSERAIDVTVSYGGGADA